MLNYKVRIILDKEGILNFGPGVERLLDGVKVHGSILKASEEMGMAYSKAWKIVKEMEKANGFKLLERTRGRNKDTVLTIEGEKLLQKYKKFKEKVESYSKEVFKEIFKEES